jgi:hypothetical protein
MAKVIGLQQIKRDPSPSASSANTVGGATPTSSNSSIFNGNASPKARTTFPSTSSPSSHAHVNRSSTATYTRGRSRRNYNNTDRYGNGNGNGNSGDDRPQTSMFPSTSSSPNNNKFGVTTASLALGRLIAARNSSPTGRSRTFGGTIGGGGGLSESKSAPLLPSPTVILSNSVGINGGRYERHIIERVEERREQKLKLVGDMARAGGRHAFLKEQKAESDRHLREVEHRLDAARIAKQQIAAANAERALELAQMASERGLQGMSLDEAELALATAAMEDDASHAADREADAEKRKVELIRIREHLDEKLSQSDKDTRVSDAEDRQLVRLLRENSVKHKEWYAHLCPPTITILAFHLSYLILFM